MSLRLKYVVAILAVLLSCWWSGRAWAQEGAGGSEGMPNPVTDTSLTLDSEAPTGATHISSDVPDVSENSTDIRIVSGGGNTTFLLVVILALFGLYLYNNQSLTRRIGRLEEALRGRAELGRERDELVPFSWNSVLRSLEGGFDLLPGLVVPQPCVLLLGNEKSEQVDSHKQRLTLITNLLRTVFQDPELVAITALHHLGSSELGHQLLSQLGEKSWENLDDNARRELLHSKGQELDHISKSLFCLNDLVLTPVQLFQTCQNVLRGSDLGVVGLDDLDVLVPSEQLSAADLDPSEQQREICDSLRLLAARCHVPVCVITDVDSATWNFLLDEGIPGAVAKLQWSDGQVRSAFVDMNGERWAQKVWTYDSQRGLLSPRQAEA